MTSVGDEQSSDMLLAEIREQGICASHGAAPKAVNHPPNSSAVANFPGDAQPLNLPSMASLPRLTMATPFSLSSAFRSLSLSTTKRPFSTTLAPQTTKELPSHIPPYPHGPRQWYKQADTGLYAGASIRFGNKISQGRNKGKTRRSWKPNVRRKKLWSEALQENLYIKVTHKALRTIQMEGGLDEYLLSDKPGRIKELGVFGWELRYKVMQTPVMQQKFGEQRKKLGLPEPKTFEEWIKTKENEINAKVQKTLNVDRITKPRPKWNADRQRRAQLNAVRRKRVQERHH